MPRTGWVVKALVLGLVSLVAQGCVSVGKYNDLQDNYRRLQMQLNDANTKLANSESQLDREKAVSQDLAKSLEEARRLKSIIDVPELEIGPQGQFIIKDEVLFDSGKATLKKRGVEVLRKVAAAIKGQGSDVRIDGHTDNEPIKRSHWESNHHLAAARALAVFEEFLKGGMKESQMFIVAWGPNKPRASNSTATGRAQNRRVEIWAGKPGSASSAAGGDVIIEEETIVVPESAPKAPTKKPKT